MLSLLVGVYVLEPSYFWKVSTDGCFYSFVRKQFYFLVLIDFSNLVIINQTHLQERFKVMRKSLHKLLCCIGEMQ